MNLVIKEVPENTDIFLTYKPPEMLLGMHKHTLTTSLTKQFLTGEVRAEIRVVLSLPGQYGGVGYYW